MSVVSHLKTLRDPGSKTPDPFITIFSSLTYNGKERLSGPLFWNSPFHPIICRFSYAEKTTLLEPQQMELDPSADAHLVRKHSSLSRGDFAAR